MDRDEVGYEEVGSALERCWFALAPVDFDPNPQCVELLGRRLVLFRTSEERIRGSDDACPHRGASLSDGAVRDDAVVCPYHGWCWQPDGGCAEIPSLAPGNPEAGEGPGTLLSDANRLRTRLDLPWRARRRDPELSGVGRYRVDLPRRRPDGVRDGRLTSTENFRDLAHLPFVHRESLGELDPEVGLTKPQEDESGIYLDYLFQAPNWMSDPLYTRYRFMPPIFAATFDFVDEDRLEPVRCLLNLPLPVNLETTVARWVVGVAADQGQEKLEEAWRQENAVYLEDKPVVSKIAPRWSEPGGRSRSTLWPTPGRSPSGGGSTSGCGRRQQRRGRHDGRLHPGRQSNRPGFSPGRCAMTSG